MVENICPFCFHKGNTVPIITVKSILKPKGLERFYPYAQHYFCTNPACVVIYFDQHENVYEKHDIKVSVKDRGAPICYCFDWTKEKLELGVKGGIDPFNYIRIMVLASRNACELLNPEGHTCLEKVSEFIKEFENEDSKW